MFAGALASAFAKDLGSKLELPPGWKFRVKVLNEDLTIRAVNGIAHIVQDDLENTYDLVRRRFQQLRAIAASFQS